MESRELGNVLGNPTAEDDRLLGKSFIETAEFRTLMTTDDFGLVVGRRGTGKSALYKRLVETYAAPRNALVVGQTLEEQQALALHARLASLTDQYQPARYITKQLWRAHLLLLAADSIVRHYKAKNVGAAEPLRAYLERHSAIVAHTSSSRCRLVLEQVQDESLFAIPEKIATTLELDTLERLVSECLDDVGKRILIAYDRIDEGWMPDKLSTSVVGGLAMAGVHLSEKQIPVYLLLFVRDNMFRALSALESEFPRNIEGRALRLRWDRDALFHLVTKRLRSFLKMEDKESDTKVWNRFAHRELKDREGFERCLRRTLYRPRDVLTLLNTAHVAATRSGRHEIIEDDIAQSARRISRERLDDLLKEYDEVLPGLRKFVDVFRGKDPLMRHHEAHDCVGAAMKDNKFADTGSRDFAIFATPEAALDVLFGTGFIGVRQPDSGSFLFCHDGLPRGLSDLESDRMVAVHPAYWKALDAPETELDPDVAVLISDEYNETTGRDAVADLRLKQLGRAVSELGNIPLGADGATDFEAWVLRAFGALFGGNELTNIELKPNGNAVQRRDVVATNEASRGFWKRVRDDYGTRQLVVEVKNYENPTLDDVRQVTTYLANEYGRFGVMVTRSQDDGLDERVRQWAKEMYDTQRKVVFVLPVSLLTKALRKMRSPSRKADWASEHLGRRLDTFVRRYFANR